MKKLQKRLPKEEGTHPQLIVSHYRAALIGERLTSLRGYGRHSSVTHIHSETDLRQVGRERGCIPPSARASATSRQWNGG